MSALKIVTLVCREAPNPDRVNLSYNAGCAVADPVIDRRGV